MKTIKALWNCISNQNKLDEIAQLVGHLQPVGKFGEIQKILKQSTNKQFLINLGELLICSLIGLLMVGGFIYLF